MMQSTSIARLVGIDLEDQVAGVEAQGLEGLLLIGVEASVYDFFAHVIEPVLAQGTGFEPFHQLVRVIDLEVEDLEHVDKASQSIGLRAIARQPIEHQRVLLGHDDFLHLKDVQVAFEDPHGEVVGDHQPSRGVLLDLTPELAVAGDLAEHVAHRDVDEAGELAQDGTLRPLAAAGHAE